MDLKLKVGKPFQFNFTFVLGLLYSSALVIVPIWLTWQLRNESAYNLITEDNEAFLNLVFLFAGLSLWFYEIKSLPTSLWQYINGFAGLVITFVLTTVTGESLVDALVVTSYISVASVATALGLHPLLTLSGYRVDHLIVATPNKRTKSKFNRAFEYVLTTLFINGSSLLGSGYIIVNLISLDQHVHNRSLGLSLLAIFVPYVLLMLNHLRQGSFKSRTLTTS